MNILSSDLIHSVYSDRKFEYFDGLFNLLA